MRRFFFLGNRLVLNINRSSTRDLFRKNSGFEFSEKLLRLFSIKLEDNKELERDASRRYFPHFSDPLPLFDNISITDDPF